MNFNSFSLCDSQKIPLDLKLDKIFNSKEKGFYIELGAFDGLSQSNTAFFEFYRKWSGILIEPSKKSYELCKINRPNSETYNLCCVSNEYKDDMIKGDFNGVTMSSVNGERLNSTDLVEVSVSTLENILNNYFINREFQTIDFYQ
jgi:hypothetical protein